MKYAKHDIHGIEGQGCVYMSMVDIHGYGWVCGDIIKTGDTGRRNYNVVGTHQKTKKQTIFGEEG